MKRRGFLRSLIYLGLITVAPIRWAAAHTRLYPGTIKKWDRTHRPGQGKWAG